MPTAAKFVAALALAIAAYGVSGVLVYRFELLQQTGVNETGFAFVAALVGWSRIGPAAEDGYRSAWTAGLGASFVTYIAIVVCSTCAHILKAVQYHAYKDVDQLLDGFISKSMEYALYMADGPVLVASIVGGLLAGTFAGFAGRLWN